MEIGKKIRIAREEQGYSQEQLANELGITARTLQNYEYGRSDIGVILVGKIANILKINSDYFFKDDSSLVVRKSFVSDEKKSISETNLKNVPKLSLNMSLNQDKYVSKLENQQEALSDDMINIPFFENVRASAGSGAYNDEESTQALGLSKSFLRECFGLYSFINLSVILGQGDSMSPTLPENCYLLIQQGEVKEGEICVTRIEDELYVKRLQKRPKLKLLSDNKAYEPIDLEGENFEILGRVVGYFKKTTL
ncbi:helix-turn-helix domain-containing protein [Campylobacter jejuni]|nr:helix-turn-helix domain-containing protein [Campylobacter jejuni]ECL2361490.1 helix-turn-helix domain-containing protein [Campylobacter jejuni]HED7248585.1 helix-turn-helix domain-containing protein [Campylobacter jejuni]HEG6281487.1 helix-turn-helix domain-containing protein [Campylobacter jejuni]